MSSYAAKLIIPFVGLVLLNIPIEEVHVRLQAGFNPEVQVVKEFWIKPRQWSKGKQIARPIVPGPPEWELLTEQLRCSRARVLDWTRASDLLGLMENPAVSVYWHLSWVFYRNFFVPNLIFLFPFFIITFNYYYYASFGIINFR